MPGPFFFCLTPSEAKVLKRIAAEGKPCTIPELLAPGKIRPSYGYLYYRLIILQTAGLVMRSEITEMVGNRPIKTVRWEATPEGKDLL